MSKIAFYTAAFYVTLTIGLAGALMCLLALVIN